MTTLGTTSAGIASRNMIYSNSYSSSFIGNKKFKQSIRPTIISGSLFMMLFFIGFSAVLFQSSQVLKCYGLCSNQLCESNQLLAGNMKNILRYGFFSAAQSFEKTISGASTNAGYLC